MKLVGLRMSGNQFELTHGMLFELPAKPNSGQYWKFLSKRLEKINYHGGTIVINLPSDEISFGRAQSQRQRLQKILFPSAKRQKSGGLWKLLGKVSRDWIEQVWIPRSELMKNHVKFQIRGFSFPYLEDIYDQECRLYLHLGEQSSRMTLAKNFRILDHRPIDFSLDKFFAEISPDTEQKTELLKQLRSVQLYYQNKKFEWQINQTAKIKQSQCKALENHLKSLFDKLSEILKGYEQDLFIQKPVIKLVGNGAMYPWIKDFLRAALDVPVRDIKPFSKMVKTGKEFNSKKLTRLEPVFAEAVSLAIAAAQPGKEMRYTTNKLFWYSNRNWFYKSKFRLFSLSGAFAVLLLYLITAFHVDRKYQQFLAMNLQYQDLSSEENALRRRVSLDSLLTSSNLQTKILKNEPRFSTVLKVIGRQIPNGNWITHLNLIPATQVKEFRSTRRKKRNTGMVIAIEGKAISSNFISDFYDRLNASGCFSNILVKRSAATGVYIDYVPYKIYAKLSD